MSDLLLRLSADLTVARKAQQKEQLLLLGTVLSEVKNREIELKRALTEDDVIDTIRKAIKRRRESVEIYVKGGREELAANERREADALETYLPAAPSDDEVRAAVREAIAAGAANIGIVMGKVMPRFKGRLDGSVINRIAREELGSST